MCLNVVSDLSIVYTNFYIDTYILAFFFIFSTRKLIIFKLSILNLFPVALVVVGCLKIAEIRQDNYGCGDQPLVGDTPDSGTIYNIFCVLMVTYALEMLFFPAIVANRIIRWLRGSRLVRKRYQTEKKGERLEQCLGGCLKCISVMCCNKAGGKELTNQGEMKDFASNLVRVPFFPGSS